MEAQTDEKLMEAVAHGNLDMLRILFERHHVHVYNFLYKMSGDKMLSEDITQEVFYKIMKYRTSYKNGKFISWLFTIARNSLNTHYSRVKEHCSDLETVQVLEKEKEDFTHLHSALEKLESSDREVLILNRFQEIKYNELAEIMGSTPGAVKTKVSRALKKLKRIYFENI
ncbi:sigma-70 family RNA polymerase sigma factor [Flavobacteriaceae bacterium 3-367]|uniref:RNA polymerase sigma factor n=1 Tax=Eudoraea algarum TaxID=3417568 RepID=UPI00328896A3